METKTCTLIPISPETSWEDACRLHKYTSVIKDSFFRDGYHEFQSDAQMGWMITDRKQNILLGLAGLVRVNAETHLRLRTDKMYWKDGVSREAALAILHFAFTQHSISAIYVHLDAAKKYLRKFLENLGFASLQEETPRLKMRVTRQTLPAERK